MLSFLKYLIFILLFLSLLLFYFIYTPLGQSNLYSFISKKISKESGLFIEVKSIDITNYPQVNMSMNIERKAKLILNGHIDDSRIDMNYNLTSDCIATDVCEIEDDVQIQGTIKGPFTKLDITGEGTTLNGSVRYVASKFTDRVENLDVNMKDINSTKLFKLLGQKTLIHGKANAHILFEYMQKDSKKGTITYTVKGNNYAGVALDLSTVVKIVDMEHTFTMDVKSKYVTLLITKGKYNQEENIVTAFYTLDIKDLSKLEKLLGYKYLGAFFAMGEIKYDKHLCINGLSKSFGGIIDFVFEKEKLHIELQNASLMEVMSLFPVTPVLDADATGDIDYDFLSETLFVNADLKKTRFLRTKIVDVIYDKAGVKMMKERFDNSRIEASFKNSTIVGFLKLRNQNSHLFLTNATVDTDKNTINAYFDFKVQKQEFSGKVYGPFDNPEVNLDMQKLIRYQMDKQVDKVIGKDANKMINHMPMGGTAKDMAAGMGAKFMNVFF